MLRRNINEQYIGLGPADNHAQIGNSAMRFLHGSGT